MITSKGLQGAALWVGLWVTNELCSSLHSRPLAQTPQYLPSTQQRNSLVIDSSPPRVGHGNIDLQLFDNDKQQQWKWSTMGLWSIGNCASTTLARLVVRFLGK